MTAIQGLTAALPLGQHAGRLLVDAHQGAVHPHPQPALPHLRFVCEAQRTQQHIWKRSCNTARGSACASHFSASGRGPSGGRAE